MMALGVNRRLTNTVSTKVLGLFVLIWLISGLAVIIPGGCFTFPLPDYFNITNTTRPEKPAEEASVITGSITIILVAIVGFALAVGQIYLVKRFSRFFVYFAELFLWVYFAIFLVSAVVNLISAFHAPILLIVVILYLILALFFGLIMRNIKKVGIDTFERIVNNSCSGVLFYPKSILITLIGFIIGSVLTYFSILVVINSNESALSIIALVLNIIAIVWIIAYLMSVIYLALGTAFITCKLEESATLAEIDSNILSVTKAHMGTVAFGSSPASIISQFIALVSFPCQWLTFVLGVLILLVANPFREMAYTITILQGSCFGESTKKTFELIFKAPLRCLVLFVVVSIAASGGAMVFGALYSSIVMSIFLKTSLFNCLLFIFIALSIPFSVVVAVINVAVATFITCDLYDTSSSNMPM